MKSDIMHTDGQQLDGMFFYIKSLPLRGRCPTKRVGVSTGLNSYKGRIIASMYGLTEEQVESIRTSIENMLDQGRRHFVELVRIWDVDYLRGREKYPISALVYTGFDTEQQNSTNDEQD